MPHKPTTRAIAPAAAATGRAKPPGQPGHRPTARGILELAKDIEGLDVDLGLSRVSNQQDIDTETLHLAGETMPSLIDSIVAAHAAGDLERLAAEVHGAKGSLASIGATSLSQQAAELEKAGKAGDRAFCDANLHPFLEGLERLGYTLHGVFTVFTSPATVLYGNRTRLESRLHKLIRALTIKDERTIERTIASVTNRDFGADVDRKLLATKDLIEKKDYTAAIKHIESYVFDIDE